MRAAAKSLGVGAPAVSHQIKTLEEKIGVALLIRLTRTIEPPTRLIFDSMQGVIQAACDGHGIGWSVRSTVDDHLQSGALETVLDSYVKELPPFYLYYPEQNRRLELLRLFIDFLISKRDDPTWHYP